MTPALRERHTLARLRSAAVDLQVSRALTEQQIGAPWAACFHAQQAGVPVQDTHDLRTLARSLPTNWPGSTWDAQAAELTLYAVDTRYPMAEQTPTWEDARQAVVLADRLTRSVLAGLRKKGVARATAQGGSPG